MRAAAILRWQSALPSQPNRPKASLGSMVLGASGRGAIGKGWVGESTSPGAPFCGTGRSTTGITGRPVSRSSVNKSPCLVGCSTAGSLRPCQATMPSVGWAGLS